MLEHIEPGSRKDTEALQASVATLMHDWEYNLNVLPKEQDIQSSSDEAVRRIDGKCGFIGKEVLFSGEGYYPVCDEKGIPRSSEWIKSQGQGVSQGVCVKPIPLAEGTYYKIMHQILLNRTSYSPHETVTLHQDVHVFLDSKALIMPFDCIRKIFAGSAEPMNDDEVLDALRESIDEFSEKVASKQFENLSEEERDYEVDFHIADTTKRLPLAGRLVAADTEYCYRPIMLPDGRVYYMPLPVDGELVMGTCRGVTSLKRSDLHLPAYGVTDPLFNNHAELCLVVEPEAETCGQFNLEIISPDSGAEPGLVLIPLAEQYADITFHTPPIQ